MLQIGRFDRDLGRGIFHKPERGLVGYQLFLDGKPLTEMGAVGLAMTGQPRLCTGLVVESVETSEADETYRPAYGEHAVHPAAYAEALVQLRETRATGRRFSLRVRVYDGCVALRYELPAQEALPASVSVDSDLTEFAFPEGSVGYECLYHEDEYWARPLHEFLSEQSMQGLGHPGAWLPVVVRVPGGQCVAVAEAGLRAGSQMCVKPAGADRLRAAQCAATPHDFANGEYRSAWRALIVADRPADLIGRSYHLEALCPPAKPALAGASWIKPGPAIRDTTLSTIGARRCIDFAAKTGMKYVLFDAGWYGAEPDEDADLKRVQLDRDRVMAAMPDHQGLDLREVIAYGKTHDVGIFLYVNYRLAEAQLDEALPVWQEWGVAGIKLGFVTVGPAQWTDWLLTCIEKCAAHNLLVNIHDAYRPTGLSRTYPNLLTQEGIRGNEHMPTATHNVSLPFTRFVIGAGDYTLCFDNDRQQGTNAHQLAMGAVYYSPYQVLYWYSRPDMVEGVAGREYWDGLPTTWDETRGVVGEIGEYVAVARRSGSTWYLGVMNNEQSRTVEVPLGFLGDGKYDAVIYEDGVSPPDQRLPLVTRRSDRFVGRDTLTVDVQASGGLAAIFSPAC